MKIAILSFYSGLHNRGVETWAESVKDNLKNHDIKIFTDIFGSFKSWSNCDMVIPTNGRWQVFLCRLVTWVKNKPMVVFGHSGPGADDKWNLLCSPNIFVAFSDYQKKWVEKYKLPWTKVIKISHAVDTNRFTPRSVKKRGKIVLCVAANSPMKRIDLVQKAVDMLPNTTLLTVGSNNPMEVTFDQMPEVYKKADVFCFVPQPWEAFGLVFLEALATNLPVVTIDDPVRREIVGEAGIFVKKPEDSKELSKAISFALNKNWSNKPRLQAEKFSWDKIRIQYDELFKL